MILFFARYIGHLRTNKSIPTDQETYLNVYEEGILIQFRKIKGTQIEIPSASITEILNVEGGKQIELSGYKKKILTVTKYKDNSFPDKEQVVVFDFEQGLQKVQSLIYEKMQKAKTN